MQKCWPPILLATGENFWLFCLPQTQILARNLCFHGFSGQIIWIFTFFSWFHGWAPFTWFQGTEWESWALNFKYMLSDITVNIIFEYQNAVDRNWNPFGHYTALPTYTIKLIMDFFIKTFIEQFKNLIIGQWTAI